MNYLAGFLLLVTDFDEESSFFMLYQLVNVYLPKYFSQNLIGMLVRWLGAFTCVWGASCVLIAVVSYGCTSRLTVAHAGGSESAVCLDRAAVSGSGAALSRQRGVSATVRNSVVHGFVCECTPAPGMIHLIVSLKAALLRNTGSFHSFLDICVMVVPPRLTRYTRVDCPASLGYDSVRVPRAAAELVYGVTRDPWGAPVRAADFARHWRPLRAVALANSNSV